MNLLIIGYSSLVARRILPAALKISRIKKIYICSKNLKEVLPEWTSSKEIVLIDGYETDLSSHDTLVYISTPNSLHFHYGRYYLERGFHVVIDKPAVLNLGEAERLTEIARKNSILLAEANVWYRHPIAGTFKSLFDSCERNHNLRIIQTFTNPPLDKSNFRYKTDFGGGILYDRASYAISLSRFLLSKYPKEIDVFVNERDNNGLDISSEVLFRFDERSILLSSYFSLNAQYFNKLQLLGENILIEAERLFTPPENYNGKVLVSNRNKSNVVDVEMGDSFQLFLEEILDSVSGDEYKRYSEEFYNDSVVLEKIINLGKKGIYESGH
ncbi:Gfo/Idh/MocA family protein [Leptospira ilyithenensis]|uniref:Gfo/Idh/MocA family oxidoreductase n=1 Tax=Leptospira ilyithenensis TaxID=2484901 RepID=A0A4R9LPX5_9LEPT|nr:Gfo/Idh/MocA family oxidoreductase [Leptospira ilyithenensis]TGN08020.1 gfo/Idh/MocA family oxidoreductase [Leptospira ilyithenensis]